MAPELIYAVDELALHVYLLGGRDAFVLFSVCDLLLKGNELIADTLHDGFNGAGELCCHNNSFYLPVQR